MSKIGIILDHDIQIQKEVSKIKEHYLNSPYGKPSSKVITGLIQGKEIALLFRHGSKGNIPAFQVNYKANMFVFHEMKCSHILATSVCGSLQEEILTEEFVIFDQFINLTTHRELTYSDKLSLDTLNHSAFNKPFSDEIRDCLIEAAVLKGYTVHTKGSVLAVDGPRQSTRAESNLYRKWGADVVNTTTAPEAILAHELGIQYGTLALCTYFDTWRTDIEPATRAEKQEIFNSCSEKLKELLVAAIEKI
jgi:5'-methylthioadenosine phosphorylase